MNETQNDIKENLRQIYSAVLQRELTGEQFSNDPGLAERLHIDSLTGLQIIVKIEQAFNVIIEDDDFAVRMLDSLDTAIDFIEVEQNRGKISRDTPAREQNAV